MTLLRLRNRIWIVSLFLAVLGARSSAAADGVIEINQARALAGGVTGSDAAGFPVTLDTAGSYALTSDLTVGGLDTGGISITSSDVTLDLRGFTIRGACPPAGCTLGSGSGVGISTTQTGTHVRDGRVRGFAGGGVSMGARSRVSGILAERNGQNGILGGNQLDVVDSRVAFNAQFGISANFQTKVIDCVAESNTGAGIVVGPHSIVSGSSARSNGASDSASGINVLAQSIVEGNLASANAGVGLRTTGQGTLLIDNVAVANTSHGIAASSTGLLQGNTSSNNGGAGLQLSGTPMLRAAYRENVVNGNAGVAVQGGVELGGNSCNGTMTCP